MAEKTAAQKDAETAVIRCETPVRMIGERMILRLPEEASAALPSRGQVSVKGTMNDRAFRTVLEPDGMRGHWLALDEEMARSVEVREGDTVKLEFAPTKDWPEPDVPQDFGHALAEASDVSGLWKDITPMARWEWVRWINATKNPETRTRRIEVGISKLQSGKRRPCCFDLASCTDPELSTSGKLVETT